MDLLRSPSSVSKATEVFELQTLLSELTTVDPRDTLPALATPSIAEFISVLESIETIIPPLYGELCLST
jgi:hypothetical protein